MRKDWELSRLQYRLATYNHFPLMIVDEIGYLPLGREESNLFFQFVSSIYEHHSTIYTSNKSFSEWGEILGDQVMASAVLDRILHHYSVINIRGDSYRLKERKKLGNVNLGEVRKGREIIQIRMENSNPPFLEKSSPPFTYGLLHS